MVKRLLFLTVGILFFQISEAFSQISIGTVDPGPYGVGGSITVPISFPDNQSEFKSDNVFTLYISNAAGVFVGNGTSIGSFTGFFTPGLNGILTGLPAGSGYKLRIRASNPNQTIDVPGTIEIKNTASIGVTLTPSFPSNNLGGDNLGWCPSGAANGKEITLRSNTTAPTVVTLQLKNLITGGITNYIETPGVGVDITNINLGYYSITVTATTIVGAETIRSIKTYHLHNTLLAVNIVDNGTTIGCINGPGQGANVAFPIGFASIINNDPTTVYNISWGDGESERRTIYEIKQNGERISHSYTRTSCGQDPIPGPPAILNSFKATITAEDRSPECSDIRSTTGYAQIFINPIARITPINSIACINQIVRFNNASTGGTRSNCSTQMDYTWYVDGFKVKESATNDPLDHKFITNGSHTIRLVASNGVGACVPSEFTTTICIQEPPKPAFDFTGNSTSHCAPFEITANDKSILDNICGDNHVYNWIVTKSNRSALPSEVIFANGIKQPMFRFLKQGTYEISLQISNSSCSPVTTTPPQTVVIIDSEPKITLNPVVDLCGLRTYEYNNTTIDLTNVQFSGTEVDLASTYTWSITAQDGSDLTNADFSFENGTNNNTKYPSIQFKQYRTYKVSVTHKNSCGEITKEQLITFHSSPTATITADKNPICYNSSVNLSAAISNGTYVSTRWEGNGTFSNINNSTATNYIPTQLERDDHKAIITFVVTTGLAGVCSEVKETIQIDILPYNTGTSTSQQLCSGIKLNYDPALGTSLAGSTFTWTATNTDLNAGNTFTTSGSGKIEDIIINSSTTANAVVIYRITPKLGGCDGDPFTLTVTVYPTPTFTQTVTKPTICSGEQSGIILTPVLPGTTYTWTVLATGDVTGASPVTIPTAEAFINQTLVNDGTLQGAVTYTITPYSTTGCPGIPVNVTVNVDPAVTVSNAGTSSSICDLGGYTLGGNPHKSNETGTWVWVPATGQSGVTIQGENLPNAVVSGLVAGQDYVFIWTISAPGACNPSSSSVTITVNPPTIAGTINGTRTVCIGDNDGNLILTANTGDVLYWESSIDGGTTWQAVANTTSTLTYNDLTTTTQYRAVVKNGSCSEKTTNIIIITVAPRDTQADAGQAQVLCNQADTRLNGNEPNVLNGESGVWTVTPITPNLHIDSSNPKTEVTGLTIGQPYTFTWTITGNSPCGPSSSQVTVINNPPISQSISSTTAEACYGQQVIIDGTVPTGGSGANYLYSWEMKVDAGNWATITDETAEDLTITPTTSGAISFRRTVTSGGCSSTSTEYLITVRPPITANNITAIQTICSGIRPEPLTGQPPLGGGGTFTYQWQSSTDEQTWTNIGGANEQDFWPMALTTTTFYRRVVSTLACSGVLQSLSNTIKITVNPNAKAEFTWVTDTGCAPFKPSITTVPHPGNATYTWFAGNTQIGTGVTFPADYAITNSNEQVNIRLVVTSSLGCTTAEFPHIFSTVQAVPASFTQNKTEGCGPLLINFVNTSDLNTGATFLWDFGNGTTSPQANPGTVTYDAEATGKDTTYVVTLTATTSCGSNSVTSTVLVKAKPIALFSPSRTDGCSPMTVNFTNTSPGGAGITYYYDFGDGSAVVSRTDKSPVQHVYNTTATTIFRATLTVVSDECGTDVKAYNIRVAPQNITPELVVDANEKEGCAPHVVNFDNNSIGATRFTYDFGDGSPIHPAPNTNTVQHIYTRPGTFTITLTAYNSCSEIATTEQVTVLPQPTAEFEADNTLGCPGLIVKFKNNTQDGFSYAWNFGDGSPISNEFEPTHTYTGDQEYYTVTLTATNTLGCTMSVSKNQYIHIVQPPVAAFNVNPSTLINIPDYTFRFEDESTNTPTIWEWDFGDGTGSALKNPSHTYLDTGTYKVTLKVLNQQGCFTSTFKNVTIKGVPGYLFVPNSFVPGNTQPELREFRAKGSGIATWRFSIFNKWGQLLWESTKLEEGRPVEGWDGTFKGQQLPQGVYYWKVDVQMVNGSEWKGMTYDSSAPKRTGAIHLIR